MSQSFQHSSTPTSLHPDRLFKKHELQKVTQYRALAESLGGELEPLAIGALGDITSSAKNFFKYCALSKMIVTLAFIAILMTLGWLRSHFLFKSQLLVK